MKKKYQCPTMRVVIIHHKQHILVGSDTYRVKDYEDVEEEVVG
jgi:hypothetical protein